MMTQTRNQRILVVDDNAAIHEDFRKIFGAKRIGAELDAAETALFGHSPASQQLALEIDSAHQGAEALSMVQKAVAEGKPYAMAFMDIRMPPGWDGVETTAQIWKADPDLQIVICTAFSDYSWDDMLQKLGQSDQLLILKKPFDNIEVLQLAHALTEKWHLLQQTKNQVEKLELKVHERTEALRVTNDNLKAEIIERQQVEAALRESQETVLRQERLAVVGQLAAGVAHEFNNVLTVIQGHTCLLLEEPDQKKNVTKSLQAIADSSERAAKVTRQMLTFSRKQTMRMVVLNPAKLIDQLTEKIISLLGNKVTLACQHTPALPNIRADLGMMEQMLVNLAVNAREAMPNGGQLSLATRAIELTGADSHRHSEARSGLFVCFSVADNGSGMDEGTLKRIFEPFFTTREVGKGTGLGLATVYGIVKQHEGWIEVTSAPEKGTKFNLFFPACDETPG
ncbi:MAG: ATP-binding protein [Verrucomicrobiota bacterium]